MAAHTMLVAFALSVWLGWDDFPPPPDELSKAYDVALTDLIAGKDRQGVADRLKPVINKHPNSPCAVAARPFLIDLTASATHPSAKMGEPPEKRLADSHLQYNLLRYYQNWEGPLKAFAAKHPNDPATELITAGRASIGRLIPLLSDRSPARCANLGSPDWPTLQPRVCDLALTLIEYHGQCRFHPCIYLHTLAQADRQQVVVRVTTWWEEVKDQSVAAGVRNQLGHIQIEAYSEKVWMATSLARLAEGQPTDDHKFALNVLHEMVQRSRRTHVGAYAAEALTKLGDTSPISIFYDEWKSWLGRPGLTHDSQIAFYLCHYGGRREWELLHAISLEEIRDGKGPGNGAVWGCAVNSKVTGTNPYAIPILGLALSQTANTGSRSVNNGSQSFSYADMACELFQKQVGKDFGYRRDGSATERLAGIKKSWAWWEAEGRTKYSFDYIEKEIAPANVPPSGPKK